MTNNIGEKIKKIRKELNLTQSQLAGSEMSKSMLSQIENNQASPSMKNLQYLASKLNKPISYFLDDIDSSPNPAQDIDPDVISEKLQKASECVYNNLPIDTKLILDDLLNTYNIDQESKLYADILYRYGQYYNLINEFSDAEKKINKAVDIYSKNYSFSNAARAYMEFMDKHWAAFQYDKCLTILNQADEIYKKSINKDVFFEVEFLYTKSVIYSSMGYMKETFSILDDAIKISNKRNIYYKTDDLYRIYALLFLQQSNYDKFKYYAEKAAQFAKFTENKKSIANIEIAYGLYYNEIANADEALKHIELYAKNRKEKTFIYYIQKAYALYLKGHYEEALTLIKRVDYTSPAYHKFDWTSLWSGKIYEGLIHSKLGDNNLAIKTINEGLEKINKFSDTKFHNLAYTNLSEIYASMDDFENAYRYLKLSKQVTDKLKP